MGDYGLLVPVGQPEAMAIAMAAELDGQRDRDRQIARAGDFTVEKINIRYLQLMIPATR